MTSSSKRWIVQYGVAVLASGTALGVRLVVTGVIGPGLPAYLFLYPAVMLSAMLYGLGPGLLATAVSALLAAYFILPPEGFAVGSPVDLLGLVIFAWMGTGISLVAGWYHRARDRAAGSAIDLAGSAEAAAAPRRAPHWLGAAPGTGPRRTPLRRWLTLLALGTAVPLLVFAVVVLVWLVGGYRADQERRHADTTRALALAVDAEVRSWKTALQTLAVSNDLQDGRLAGFYEEARAVAARYEGWIVLTDASGQQRLNTRRPFGAPLPTTGTPDVIQAVFRDRQPVVTDLVFGAVSQRYIVAVVIPVIREGQVLYTLDMAFVPERLTRLLADQRFPATWISAINDGQQKVVARVPERPDRQGQPAARAQARAFAAQDRGTLDATLSDGRVGRIAFQRLREAPWTVSVVVPVTELQAAWQRPIIAFLLLGGLAACGVVGLAMVVARKIARPVTEAARLAGAVVRGEAPTLPPSRIAEVADLQHALADGAASVRTETQAREQALIALRETNEMLKREVGQRQQTESHLQRTNRVLRLLSACNEALVRLDDEPALTREICRIAVEIGGYRMAWVGLAEPDADQTVRPVAATGSEEGYLERAQITWADSPRGHGPTGTAIRTGTVQIGDDFLTEARLAPWRTEALARGFRSSIALPLCDGEHVLGALTIYAVEPQAFQAAEVPVLRELADGLAFGLHAVRMRRALRESRDRVGALTGELALAEQRERQRLGEVLHDGLQQFLVAARMHVDVLARRTPGDLRASCQQVYALLEDAIKASRALTAELSPPILHTAGFVPALEWLARWMADKHHLTVTLHAEADIEVKHEAAKVLLFQAVRELLFNAVKHAGVSEVVVEVRGHSDTITIEVADQGAGFDPERAHATGGTGLGLPTIRQRLEYLGGRLDVSSAPGQGSRFTLTVPLQP